MPRKLPSITMQAVQSFRVSDHQIEPKKPKKIKRQADLSTLIKY